jgi:charged multivesicular body protein 6
MGCLLCPTSRTTKINQEERALLDCKICRDNIKKYIKSLEKNSSLKKQKAKEALKNKNRDRAKLYMRQSKMYQEQIKASEGKLEMIETQISQIETAQNQLDVFNVLKQGNNILKKLQEEVNVEKIQEIADDLNELKEQNDEITQFFKEKGIEENDEEIDNELDKLIDNVQKEEGKIDLPLANKEKIEENDNIEINEEKEKKNIEIED